MTAIANDNRMTAKRMTINDLIKYNKLAFILKKQTYNLTMKQKTETK